VLMHAGLEPNVIVGSLLKKQKINFIPGKGRHLVVEADEYQRSFLNLSPYILVITNIGEDHLDYYKDIADIQSAFSELASKIPKSGFLITRTKDDLLREVIAACKGRVIDYVDFLDNHIALPVPGKHNRENAAVALAVAHVLGIQKEKAVESLESFSGTWRRFDYRGKTSRGTLVYDDYAHNPDKVRAAIAGYREAYPKKRLTVIFQPHLYSRTKTLMNGFIHAFDSADEVFMVPIFAAREQVDASVSSEILVERMQEHLSVRGVSAPKIVYAPDLNKLAVSLKRRLGKNDLMVTMGAGDIYELTGKLVAKKND
jgi:UDP-N-acetylmuramate--alanine ligase